MKIPATVKIGGFTWKIEEHQGVAEEGGVFGSTHSHTQKIFIEPGLTQQKKEQTLLHEILHAIWWQSGLNARYKNDKTIIEEEITQAIGHGLYQVLKDNNLLK